MKNRALLRSIKLYDITSTGDVYTTKLYTFLKNIFSNLKHTEQFNGEILYHYNNEKYCIYSINDHARRLIVDYEKIATILLLDFQIEYKTCIIVLEYFSKEFLNLHIDKIDMTSDLQTKLPYTEYIML